MTSREPIYDDLIESKLLPAWARRISSQLTYLTKEIKAMSADQDKLDADVTALTGAISAVEVEVDSLKAQVAAGGGNLDFSGLDAAVAKLQSDEPNTPPAA